MEASKSSGAGAPSRSRKFPSVGSRNGCQCVLWCCRTSHVSDSLGSSPSSTSKADPTSSNLSPTANNVPSGGLSIKTLGGVLSTSMRTEAESFRPLLSSTKRVAVYVPAVSYVKDGDGSVESNKPSPSRSHVNDSSSSSGSELRLDWNVTTRGLKPNFTSALMTAVGDRLRDPV